MKPQKIMREWLSFGRGGGEGESEESWVQVYRVMVYEYEFFYPDRFLASSLTALHINPTTNR